MNKIIISKFLDILALLCIVIVFAIYLFKRPSFVFISFSLIIIAIIKMLSAMIKANHYNKLYEQIQQENDILKEKVEYLEQKTQKNQ